MDPWTPATRDAFIEEAKNSTDTKKVYKGSYYYRVMPKIDTASEAVEDVRRAAVTDVLSETLYTPNNKHIVLNAYSMLCQRLMTHPYIGCEYNRNFVVLLKGSNAYAYLAKLSKIPEEDMFKNSDTDIVVIINPYLPREIFYNIKYQVEIAIKQVLSQYKRALDCRMFLGRPLDNDMLDADAVENFKTEFNDAISAIDIPGYRFYSPFEATEVRNKCSRNSFLITNNVAQENSVVMVELPHFERCERIPLRMTPMCCSFNETIDFMRDGVNKKGKFNLYRLRMNVLCETFDDEGNVKHWDRIPADFVDISVPDINDVELQYFWSRGRSINVYDTDVNMWITIPDMMTIVTELKRILTEYDCPDSKRQKRQLKLSILEKYV